MLFSIGRRAVQLDARAGNGSPVKDSPVYLEAPFDLAAEMVKGQSKMETAFRTGAGVAWGESSGCLSAPSVRSSAGLRQRHRAGMAAVPGRRRAQTGCGSQVADIGCGVAFRHS